MVGPLLPSCWPGLVVTNIPDPYVDLYVTQEKMTLSKVANSWLIFDNVCLVCVETHNIRHDMLLRHPEKFWTLLQQQPQDVTSERNNDHGEER